MKSKEQKKMEATVRAEAYAKLTPAQKIAKLNRDQHTATKQRKRLAKQAGHK